MLCYSYLNAPRFSASVQYIRSKCKRMDITSASRQTSDKLLRLKVPDIDFAIEAPTIKERAISSK